MTATMRRYLIAMGSIMDLAPATNYRRMAAQGRDQDRLKKDIEYVGKDMTKVITGLESYHLDEKK
ncbi:hypothetical protein IR150_18240 [Providencia alcalifaciens]|uniref:hypothetical protein n=1 Tax=Providencia alcalifaciens TaxID=126385 RepID=UPI0015D0AAED|nr:hypothetical protein [Providencia alcalifaciens]MBF0693388.1 hypothetical protein [Providencia alcalifaciens]NYS91892.1 hypothetical protein [Providencia alcalifaciens]